jgi:hypothetical protein
MKQKRKLRIFISNTFYPAKEPADGEEGSVASWELRVEGRLLEDSKNDPNKVRVVVRTTVMNQNCILEEIKSRLRPGNASCLEVPDFFFMSAIGSIEIEI